MKIVQAKNIGFCMGVERAVRKSLETLNKERQPIYSYGEVIHNPFVNTQLKTKGLKIIHSLNQINSKGILIVPSHGMPPSYQNEASKKGLKIIDVTCPFVLVVQRICQELKDKGYFVIIVGDRQHPEIKTLLSIVKQALVVDTSTSLSINGVLRLAQDASKDAEQSRSKCNRTIDSNTILSDNLLRHRITGKKLGIISQTTQDRDYFLKVVQVLVQRCNFLKEVRIFNTICSDTVSRQEEIKTLAKQVDRMIVIGGKNSANTKRLVQISSISCPETCHIQDDGELKEIPAPKNGRLKIGIASGASTPYELIEQTVRKMNRVSQKYPLPLGERVG